MVEAASHCAFSIEYCRNEHQSETRAVDWSLWSERMWGLSVEIGGTHIHWYRDGDLNEEGRKVILERFGLLNWQDKYPLEKLQFISPAILARKRRKKEKTYNLPECLLLISDSIDHRSAEVYN